MGFLDDFEDLCNIDLTIAPYTGQDEAGNEAYGSTTTVKAYAEVTLGRGPSGGEVVGPLRVTQGVIIVGTSTVKPKDRLTWTDPVFGSVTEYVTNVDTYVDPEDVSTIHHQEITWEKSQ